MNIICVTQKKIVCEDFLTRIKEVLKAKPYALILREKELPLSEYAKLAEIINEFCIQYDVALFLNADLENIILLSNKFSCNIHTSFENYVSLLRKNFKRKNIKIGISIHNIQEAEFIIENQDRLPVSHLIAGHIFETDCKKNLKARGLDFLEKIVRSTQNSKNPKIPVFAIGGINHKRAPSVIATGASGCALMSSLMTCENPKKFIESFL